MRKHELVADAAAGLVKPEEGSLAHTVDELVKTITTPLLGELPESPSISERQPECEAGLSEQVTMSRMRSSGPYACTAQSTASNLARARTHGPCDTC
jgi:hypothetical protein